MFFRTYIDCLYSFSVASYIWTLRLALDVLACSNVYKDWRFLCGLRGSGYNILWIRTLRSKMENKWKQWFDAIPPFWNSIWLPPPCRSELNPFWLPLQLQVQTTKKNKHWSYWPGAGEALRTIAKDVATALWPQCARWGRDKHLYWTWFPPVPSLNAVLSSRVCGFLSGWVVGNIKTTIHLNWHIYFLKENDVYSWSLFQPMYATNVQQLFVSSAFGKFEPWPVPSMNLRRMS